MQVIGIILFLAFGIAQIIAGFVGISYYFGPIMTVIIFAACLFLRFSLPITVFGFLGAMYAWDWPWWGALLFSFPGLLFAIPALLAGLMEVTGIGRNSAR
jgi:hypothetical protein